MFLNYILAFFRVHQSSASDVYSPKLRFECDPDTYNSPSIRLLPPNWPNKMNRNRTYIYGSFKKPSTNRTEQALRCSVRFGLVRGAHSALEGQTMENPEYYEVVRDETCTFAICNWDGNETRNGC